MKSRLYLPLLALFLLQLFVRVHQNETLPLFTDEYSHIERATGIYEFNHHPAKYGSGKFLLYLLLGVFDLSQREAALFLSRMTVALASLLISAMLFLIGRHFFNERAGLLAVALYALIPYAFFYERMALADSWAACMGIITLWLSYRMALKPTRTRAIQVGTFAALSVAAKMTLGLVVGFPVVAALIFGHYASLRDGVRRYWPPLFISGVTFTFWWLWVLIPALIERLLNPLDTTIYLFVSPDLTEGGLTGESVSQKVVELWEKLATMAAPGMGIALILLGLVALRRFPQKAGYILACLALTWTPSVVLATNLQTRYLSSGLPEIALLFGAGIYGVALWVSEARRPLVYAGAVAGMTIWALTFSLPFARALMTEPTRLNLPALDERNYFWHWFNNYGTLDALDYLRETGQAGADGRVHVVGLLQSCMYADLQANLDGLTLACPDKYGPEDYYPGLWEEYALPPLQAGNPVYIISDRFHSPPPNTPLNWEFLTEFPRPQNRSRVGVWVVSLSGGIASQ